MSSITAEIDGQTFTVDLAKITGLDALAFRGAVGVDLDGVVAGWVDAGTVVALADLAVVKWLWARQQVDPLVPLAAVAATVMLLPAEGD